MDEANEILAEIDNTNKKLRKLINSKEPLVEDIKVQIGEISTIIPPDFCLQTYKNDLQQAIEYSEKELNMSRDLKNKLKAEHSNYSDQLVSLKQEIEGLSETKQQCLDAIQNPPPLPLLYELFKTKQN